MKNKFGFLCLAMSILMTVIFPAGKAYAQLLSEITMSMSTNEIQPNGEFMVNVNANNISGLYAFEVTLSYDEEMLQSVHANTLLQGFKVGPIVKNGHVTFAFTKTENAAVQTGQVTLCSFRFKGIHKGSATVQLSQIKMLDHHLEELLHDIPVENLTVRITAEEPTPGADPTADPAPSPVPHPAEREIKIVTESDGSAMLEVRVDMDETTGRALVDIEKDLMTEVIRNAAQDSGGVKNIKLDIHSADETLEFAVTLPAEAVTQNTLNAKIEIKTPVASVVIPSNMFAGVEVEGMEKLQFSIRMADRKNMNESLQKRIGDRPVIELHVMLEDRVLSWNNPNAPVTVSINYTPTPEELEDPEHIVVWYIDGQGNVLSIPNGKYDTHTGKVTFTVTHFSQYAVSFVKKTFNDIGNYDWAKKQIEVLASREIINGTAALTYSPGEDVSRADFVLLLVRVLGMTADFETHFDDVKQENYFYDALGIARQLGIINGMGSNKFHPDMQISRQDMMVMAARALKATQKKDMEGSFNDLSSFYDAQDVSDYAASSIGALIRQGIIQGDNNKLNPNGTAKRAEAAVLIYRIYDKYL